MFRRQWTPAVDALAGRRYWYAAAVHHVGRSSGRPYEIVPAEAALPFLAARRRRLLRVFAVRPYLSGRVVDPHEPVSAPAAGDSTATVTTR